MLTEAIQLKATHLCISILSILPLHTPFAYSTCILSLDIPLHTPFGYSAHACSTCILPLDTPLQQHTSRGQQIEQLSLFLELNILQRSHQSCVANLLLTNSSGSRIIYSLPPQGFNNLYEAVITPQRVSTTAAHQEIFIQASGALFKPSKRVKPSRRELGEEVQILINPVVL